MPLLENELARRENGRLQVRPGPVRVRWAFDDLHTADGHTLRVAFDCSVQAHPDSSDRQMLQEVLLKGRAAVRDQDVQAHFAPALRSAATRAVKDSNVADLLADAGKQKVAGALREGAGPVAFNCGLELLPPFHVEAESPSLQQQQLRDMQRKLAEQQAAGQVEHFQRAAELLKQFQSAREAAPDLSAGHVLQQISPADRGSVLKSLLLASAQRDKAEGLWAVAGGNLVKIDARSTPPRTQVFPLPESAGPLRSVQPADVDGKRMLLVGARAGFLLVSPDAPDKAEVYVDPEINSQLGFSRVLYAGERFGFVACHGDGGLVTWTRGQTDGPSRALRPQNLNPADSGTNPRPAGPRNLQKLDDEHLLFSLSNRLAVVDTDGAVEVMPAESQAEVVAIVPDGRNMLVAHRDGTVCVLDAATRKTTCKERRAGRVTAAGGLPWLGGRRLLLAPEAGPIQCVGLDDELVTQYASNYHDLPAVAGSADVVAAVSPDRQRLILWHSWDGRQPAAELHLFGIARHRVADVDFA